MAKHIEHGDSRDAATPSYRISLSTQILSGITAMVTTMGLLLVTLPPHEVSKAGEVFATAPFIGDAAEPTKAA